MPDRQFDNFAHYARHTLTAAQIEVGKLNQPVRGWLFSRPPRHDEIADRREAVPRDSVMGCLALALHANPAFTAQLSDEKRARTPASAQEPLRFPSQPDGSPSQVVVEAVTVLANAITQPVGASLSEVRLVVRPGTQPEQAFRDYQSLVDAQQQQALLALRTGALQWQPTG